MRGRLKEMCRASNVSVRSQSMNKGIVQNDIMMSFANGTQMQTIPVTYSTEDVLNRPSIGLEELPTDNHYAQSEMQFVLDNIKNQQVKKQKTQKIEENE